MKYSILPALIAASAALSACDTAESPSETYANRLQTTEQLPVSNNIALTAAGNRLPLQTATQTRISFAQNELNEANPPMTQADCTLTSSAFSGALRVPGKVNLPSFGRATPPMTIACTDGKKTTTQTVEVTNLTKLKAQENAAAQVLWGGGLLGAAVLAGMSSERDKSLDLYGYPPQIQIK